MDRKDKLSPYEYGHHLVKVHLQDGEESAYVWTILVEADDGEMTVELSETPPEFVNHSAGQQLLLREEDVYYGGPQTPDHRLE